MLSKCALCGGEIKLQKVEKIIRVVNDTVSITVNAEVCNQCGEAYYTPEIVEKLQKVRKELKDQISIKTLCTPQGYAYHYNKIVSA